MENKGVITSAGGQSRLNSGDGSDKQTAPPDPEKHLWVSMLKSSIRIFGFICLLFDIDLGVAFLIFAELFGILEELV